MSNRIFCTCVTSNYLNFILPLKRSLINSENSEELYVIVADDDVSQLRTEIEGITFISLNELPDPVIKEMIIYFGPGELANALKPFCIEYLLKRTKISEVIYVDCDLYFTSKLPHLFKEQLQDKMMLFTPHIIEIKALKERVPRELDIADMGILNGGFIAIRNHPKTFEILAWLKERFSYFGFDDRKNGYFLDQKLLPLLLTLFPNEVGIEFSPLLNIAFWNSHEREVQRRGNTYYIDEKPVIFFHMSGARLNSTDTQICTYISKKENLEIIKRAPWLQDVLTAYKEGLKHSNDLPTWPYKYTSYNGFKMFPELRRYYFVHKKLTSSPPVLRMVFIQQLKLVNRFIRKNLKSNEK